jgi:hypothetical protein
MNHGDTEVAERVKKMNREEIQAEVDAISLDRFETQHARHALIAWLEHQNDLAIDQQCPYCFELLSVADNGEASTVSCHCGKSESVFRGL